MLTIPLFFVVLCACDSAYVMLAFTAVASCIVVLSDKTRKIFKRWICKHMGLYTKLHCLVREQTKKTKYFSGIVHSMSVINPAHIIPVVLNQPSYPHPCWIEKEKKKTRLELNKKCGSNHPQIPRKQSL